MNKLITDHPKNNIETMMNMVYDKDGWQYIRHGEDGMSTVDFCMMLCKEHGCEMTDYEQMTNAEKDEILCDCVFNECPVATVYAALSGFGHVRNRLKKYEDAGMMPPEAKRTKFYFAVKDGSFDSETGETGEAGLIADGGGFSSAEECAAFLERKMPHLSGRLRKITEEEYKRDYGEDEDDE